MYLTKGVRGGQHRPTAAVELAELSLARPCKTCYPDAPRIKVVRRFCPICNTNCPQPCEHNGGVRVTVSYKTSYISLLRDPGQESLRVRWVWPDLVHFYDSIAS